MTGRQLTTHNSAQSVAKVSAANLPLPISSGIFDLLAAFAAGPNQDDADKKRLLRIYAEAVAGFPAAVAERAIRRLKLRNPRNPFRPTPQDVFEACEWTAKVWRDRVLAYFTSRDPKYTTWGWEDGRGPEWGSAPFSEGSLIPAGLVHAILCAYLAEIGVNKSNELADLGRERFMRIPADCFAIGLRAEVLAMIAKAEAREEARTKTRAHEAALDPELRWYRLQVMRYGDCLDKSDEEITALAKAAMADAHAEKERKEATAIEQRKRMIATNKPEVRQALNRMHDMEAKGTTKEWADATHAYVTLLTAENAQPTPELISKLKQAGINPTTGELS